MTEKEIVLSINRLRKTISREFPKKEKNAISVRTFIYEILDYLIPLRYDYNGKKVSKKKLRNYNNSISESLIRANNYLKQKKYDEFIQELIYIDNGLTDISFAVKVVRKNLKKIIKYIEKKESE